MPNRNVIIMLARRELEEITGIMKTDLSRAEQALTELLKKSETYDNSKDDETLCTLARINYLMGKCLLDSSEHEKACVYFEKAFNKLLFISNISDLPVLSVLLDVSYDYSKALSACYEYRSALKVLNEAVNHAQKTSAENLTDKIINVYSERSLIFSNLGYKRNALRDINFVIKKLKKLYHADNSYLLSLVYARSKKADIIIRHSLFKFTSMMQVVLGVVESWAFHPENVVQPKNVFEQTMREIGDTIFSFSVSFKALGKFTDAVQYAGDESVNGNVISLVPTSYQEEFLTVCEDAETKELPIDRLFMQYFFYNKMFKYLSYILREENLPPGKLHKFQRTCKRTLFYLKQIAPQDTVESKVMLARYHVLLAEFCIRRRKFKPARRNLDTAFEIYSALVSGNEEINKPKAMYAFCFIQERRAYVYTVLKDKKKAASLLSYTADVLNDIKADIPLLTLSNLITMLYTRSAMMYDDIGEYNKAEKKFTYAIDVFDAFLESDYAKTEPASDESPYNELVDCAALNYFRRAVTKTRQSTRNYSSALRDYIRCAELLNAEGREAESREKLSIVYRATSEIYEAFGEYENSKKYYLLSQQLKSKNAETD